MTLRLLLLLFAACVGVSAQSQPPTPGNANTNRPAKKQTSNQTNQTQPVPSLSQQLPPINVSVNTTSVAEAPRTEQSHDGDGTTADWWMVGITLVATVLGAFGAYTAWQQFKNQHSQTMEALRYAREGLDTARQDQILTHRPKLIVRNVVVDGLMAGVGFVPNKSGEMKLTNCRLWITNVGLTDAVVLRTEIQWFFGSRLPMENPINADVLNGGVTQNLTIKAGEIREINPPDYPFDFTGFQHINNAAEKIPMKQQKHLWLIGYVRYQDSKGTFLRHTFFCRKYDAVRGFFKIDRRRADYSYVD